MKIEQQFRALFENGIFPVTYISPDGRVMRTNIIGAKNLGGVPDDFVGRSIYEFLPDMADAIKKRIKQVLEAGVGGQYEDCVKLPDGERWFSSFLQPVRDEGGKITAIQVICEDNTERVKAKQELQKTESRYRQIVENAATPIMYHALDGTILVINTAGARNLGGIPADFIGRPIEELLPLQAVKMRERIAQVAESGIHATEFEDCVDLPSGKRWFSSNIQPVTDESGEAVAVQIISLDITERKWAESSLRDLSHRVVEVQEFERRHIARELHDQVGQALTGLKFCLEIAVHESAEKRKESFSEAQTIIDDLMTRVRTMSLDLRPSMLDDLGLLPALLAHFKRYTAQTGIQVVFQHQGIQERLSPKVETEVYRIVQEALTNVARHARVPEVTVHILAQSGLVALKIKDEGIGFDPTLKTASGQTSGLIGMRERAVLLGGGFTLHSVPGEGTELVVELSLKGPDHIGT
ncbi:MAG: PAS domain-containing protein [Chloroflexi bacterium]|jgi:PAS domain S-box-containing protein|nr:PAS domain-containing protein [Chloroflexota bacterium]